MVKSYGKSNVDTVGGLLQLVGFLQQTGVPTQQVKSIDHLVKWDWFMPHNHVYCVLCLSSIIMR